MSCPRCQNAMLKNTTVIGCNRLQCFIDCCCMSCFISSGMQQGLLEQKNTHFCVYPVEFDNSKHCECKMECMCSWKLCMTELSPDTLFVCPHKTNHLTTFLFTEHRNSEQPFESSNTTLRLTVPSPSHKKTGQEYGFLATSSSFWYFSPWTWFKKVSEK